MKIYYVTFGQKWRRNKHPKGGHPDGWFAVKGRTVSEATALTNAFFGRDWASIYDPESYGEAYFNDFYPLRLLGVIPNPAETSCKDPGVGH